MAFSQQILTDITSVINNGPQGNTPALAIAASGYIMDYPGMTKSIKLHFQEAKRQLQLVIDDTDTNQDSTNLTLLQNILNDLV